MNSATSDRSPRLQDYADHLPVMETFYSIQGEGYHQGKAAAFIRLAGCDVGCHWCDVKESWNVEDHPTISVDKLASDIDIQSAGIVIVTGGEPLMHNLDKLCNRLDKYNYQKHIETSGAYALSGQWDWICLSPKKFKKPLPEVCQKAHELKVVVYNKPDFAWAESFTDKVNKDCRLYLQPEWSRREEVMPMVVAYVKANPQWSISLQIHKYLGVD